MPFFLKKKKEKKEMEWAAQVDKQSLYFMDTSQEASTQLLSPLGSFFSCSISCQICKLLLKVTQELIRDQPVSKRQQKNEACIR